MALSSPLDRSISAWEPNNIRGKLLEYLDAIRNQLAAFDAAGGALLNSQTLLAPQQTITIDVNGATHKQLSIIGWGPVVIGNLVTVDLNDTAMTNSMQTWSNTDPVSAPSALVLIGCATGRLSFDIRLDIEDPAGQSGFFQAVNRVTASGSRTFAHGSLGSGVAGNITKVELQGSVATFFQTGFQVRVKALG